MKEKEAIKSSGRLLIILSTVYALIWVVPSMIPTWTKALFLGGGLLVLAKKT